MAPTLQELSYLQLAEMPMALLLSTPSIMVLIWPSLDKGTCRVPWLSHTKLYAQLTPLLMSRVSFLTASSKEERHAWCGCAHTAASLNIISPSMVLPGMIKRYVISCWGFSASPHAPAQERAKSSDWVTSVTWNHDREGQISWDPHSIWVNFSIGWGLWQNVHSCPLLLLSVLEGGSKWIPGGDTGQGA